MTETPATLRVVFTSLRCTNCGRPLKFVQGRGGVYFPIHREGPGLQLGCKTRHLSWKRRVRKANARGYILIWGMGEREVQGGPLPVSTGELRGLLYGYGWRPDFQKIIT